VCPANAETKLGKHIAQRLLASSTAVTIVDHIFHSDELGLSSNSLLTLHIGDVRNTTLLSSVFTSDVVGVVHLAGISRVLQCEENPRDCTDVNERGTQLVLDSLEQLNKQDQGKRWFVLASSLEVYDPATTAAPIHEDAPTKPSSVYGTSKLSAERTVETRVRSIQSFGTLHAVALRLSHVYGGLYDHGDRLIPSIATQALWNQVIQVSGGDQIVRLPYSGDRV
jgi:nucleoside-diphosphate-sugar epimerase